MPRAAVAVATGSLFASFAHDVNEAVREKLRAAEVAGLRGRPDDGLRLLTALLADADHLGEDDLVAIAELTGVLRVWGGSDESSVDILQTCSDRTQEPRARGAVLLSRARSQPASYTRYCTEALAEFSAADDLRGRAVVLARLAIGSRTSPPAHRFRLGHEAVELAEQLDDPWTLAFCRGHLAILETYLGAPAAAHRWRQSVEVATGRADSLAAQMITMNYNNHAFTALGFGDYALASSVLAEGATTARGPSWQSRFANMRGWLHLRLGDLRGAAAELPTEDSHTPLLVTFTAAVSAAISYERDRHLEAEPLAELLDGLMDTSEQIGCFAAGVLAMTRHARNEPNPGRDARVALHRVHELGYRFGWEDAMLGLALVSPDEGREEATRMADLWPDNPRGHAIRAFVDGLVATPPDQGFDVLVEAAAALQELPEPITAGWALHAAAKVAPSVELGNQLRRTAIELFERCGAERSLAAVVRDRTLSRGPDHVPVPGSQARTVTAGLTAKEREVAVLAARGLTAAEIARELGISTGTVRNHLMQVRTKFGGIPKRRLAKALGISEDGH